MLIPDAYWAYLEDGSATALAAVHAQIKADPYFTEQAPWYPRAGDLLRQDRFDEVIDLLEELMPGVFLCPEAHSMLGYAYEHLDEHERSRAQYTFAGSALAAIQSSGRGTRTAPWRVLRIIDEYAQLRSRRIEPVSQRMTVAGGRRFDVHHGAGDAEYWFELV